MSGGKGHAREAGSLAEQAYRLHAIAMGDEGSAAALLEQLLERAVSIAHDLERRMAS